MRIRLTAIACVTALAAAACGSGAGEGPGAPGGPLSGTINVQASGGDAELAALREMIGAFEKAHSGVKVEFVGVADQGDHLAKLSTSFAGGRPPDVFLVNYRRLGPFAEKRVVEPAALAPLSAGDFYAPAVEAFTFDGTLLCLPQNVSSVVTYVNPALFGRAGVPLPAATWTWDDLRSAATALAAKGLQAVGFDPNLRTLAPFVWSSGGDIVDDLDAPTRVTLDTEAGRAATSFLLDLQKTGLDAVERAASSAEDRFARGELAVFLDSRRAVPAFRKAGLDFDVRRLPANRGSASLLASDGYCVTKASRNKAAAQAFARFAVGPEGGAVLASTGRTVPSLRSLAESPAFLDPAKPPKSSRVFLDAIPTLRRMPSVGPWHEAEEKATDILDQLFAGRMSLDQALRRIETDTKTVFDAAR